MSSRSKDVGARLVQISAFLLLALSMSVCAARPPLRNSGDASMGIELGELWVEPRDLDARDLFHGAGGSAYAPDASVPFELVAVDHSGFSPGYEVLDQQNTKWDVKLGIEAQPEIVASRVLWALGYHQPATYLLTKWVLVGGEQGTQGIARFRRQTAGETVVADWSWHENPFVTTQPFRGLIVANLILNHWDWKTSNNKVYNLTNHDGERRRVYVVRDLGASLGKTTFPKFLAWTPLRGMPQGSRNDLAGFEEQGFIRKVEGQHVEFDYHGANARLVKLLTVDDVVWTCRLMARISDAQWRDAFRAAGYGDAERQRYVRKLKSKIGEGLALAGS